MEPPHRATTVEAKLAFTPVADVSADDERKGLLRARTRPPEAHGSADALDLRTCRIRDWSEDDRFQPDLFRHGFDCVDLSSLAALQAVLENVRDAGHVRLEDARQIRQRLTGESLRLDGGTRIRLLFVAPEGFIMRKAGPNGMLLSQPGSMTQMNDHDAAQAVHADQDVRGTPLRQMMHGAAPWLFRHDAPDSRNHWSPLLLLNLWIPLQQITRPLALMDKRSLDRRAHQLRYGLPTDAFLDRDEERRVNDIWTFLHDDHQQWYFHQEMQPTRAYVFETLGTPHGSFIVPGEELAEARYRQLAEAKAAIGSGDVQELQRATRPGGASIDTTNTTPPLRRAIEAMSELIEEARRDAESICGRGSESWQARAKRAMDSVVRKSIEMRVVAARLPGLRRS